MLKIRLQRTGRKHETTFRIVLTDSQNATKSGKYLEVLGNYDPRKTTEEIKADRVKYWISVGAQPSGTLHNLFIEKKIITGKKINVLPKKTVPKKEEVAPEKSEQSQAPKEEVKTETPVKEEVKAEEVLKVEEKKAETPVA